MEEVDGGNLCEFAGLGTGMKKLDLCVLKEEKGRKDVGEDSCH